MTRYVIIDDEPIAHRIIEGYCEELPYLQKAGNAYNVFQASEILSRQKVDLVFLDINMPKMTGFEWLKTVSNPPGIIVTSAYREYALEGYELNILDYLLKPFSFVRFLKAINKVNGSKKEEVKRTNPGIEGPGSIFLKGDKTHHQIHLQDILFVEAYGNYVKVFFKAEMKVSHQKISTLEDLLPKSRFIRVHKSFIVSLDRIEQIQGNQIFIHRHKIPIGQTYRNGIKDLLGG